ncbi:hypothetical protein B0T16DRAFT_209796 [Cercophora newfieldiana]|uniref:C2H2-type domain-containing protein n=1 Tax=Cercophora newfieldiana TaxID=92897 RepID=A0AA39XWL4_9PEZI|nr:hypothetical protein B0T16DRAFT_209796 [Cercophora newfieldiana]
MEELVQNSYPSTGNQVRDLEKLHTQILPGIISSLSQTIGAWRVFNESDRCYFKGTTQGEHCFRALRKTFRVLEFHHEKLQKLEALAKNKAMLRIGFEAQEAAVKVKDLAIVAMLFSPISQVLAMFNTQLPPFEANALTLTLAFVTFVTLYIIVYSVVRHFSGIDSGIRVAHAVGRDVFNALIRVIQPTSATNSSKPDRSASTKPYKPDPISSSGSARLPRGPFTWPNWRAMRWPSSTLSMKWPSCLQEPDNLAELGLLQGNAAVSEHIEEEVPESSDGQDPGPVFASQDTLNLVFGQENRSCIDNRNHSLGDSTDQEGWRGAQEGHAENRDTLESADEATSDSEDSIMSDTTYSTDTSLIEAFEASPFPLNPELLSVLLSLEGDIMDRIKQKAQPATTTQADGGSAPSSRQPAPSPSEHRTSRGNFGHRKRQFRKADDDDDDDGESDRDDGDKRQKPNSAFPESHPKHLPRKLACPFYKRHPNSGDLHKSCRFSGWKTGHRIKEHIYRRHYKLEYQCPRCWTSFDEKRKFDDHIVAEQRCEAKIRPEQGESRYITEPQHQELKKRDGGRKVSEEVRWARIYGVLFPEVPTDSIPSPYQEVDFENLLADEATMAAFQNVLEQELPPRIENHRRVQLGQGDELQNITQDMIRTSIREVFEEYLPSLVPANRRREEITGGSAELPAERLFSPSPIQPAHSTQFVAANDGQALSSRQYMPLLPGNIGYATVQAPQPPFLIPQQINQTAGSGFINFNYDERFLNPNGFEQRHAFTPSGDASTNDRLNNLDFSSEINFDGHFGWDRPPENSGHSMQPQWNNMDPRHYPGT